MGCFVPLAFIAFFFGRPSTPEEEEEDEAAEEEEELLASSKDAELWLPLDESKSAATLIPRSLHRPLVSIPNPIRQERLQSKTHSRCQSFCHLQSDLGLHYRKDFFGSLPFFLTIP